MELLPSQTEEDVFIPTALYIARINTIQAKLLRRPSLSLSPQQISLLDDLYFIALETADPGTVSALPTFYAGWL